jgi:DNA-binding NarL/FixJ family response regulator
MRLPLMPLRAAVAGAAENELRAVLIDVLAELEIDLDEHVLRPDLVLAFLGRDDVEEVMAVARERGQGAPIIAVLPFLDERLVRRAHACGATGFWPLDSSTRELRRTLQGVLLGRIARTGGLRERN